MSAADIIQEIKQLSPEERAKVADFIYESEGSGKLSGRELSEIARRMIVAETAEEKETIKTEIARGFYGD